MNLNTAFLQSRFRPQPEESRHRMSAPAQAVPLPICLGTITTSTNSKKRSSKDGDKEVWSRMNTTEKYSVNYIGLQENIKQIP